MVVAQRRPGGKRMDCHRGLAAHASPCQSNIMANSPPSIPDSTPPERRQPPGSAGGCLIAAGALLGPIIGLFMGEVTLGLLGGLAVGVLGAIAMMIAQRRR